MSDEKRIEAVLTAIGEKTDYSLIGKLEFVNGLTKSSELKNFVLILLVLIEKSPWHESASNLLLRKIYDPKFTEKLTEVKYGDFFIEVVKDKAYFPYVGISTTFRRLISSIIYDKTGQETKHFVEITPKDKLLSTNEYMLEKYLTDHSIDNDTLSLYYTCVEDIHPETNHVTLSSKSSAIIKKKIIEGELISYLRVFIRPYYSSPSGNFEGASYHVPEPFYLQIFESNDEFLKILGKALEYIKSDQNKAEDEKLIKEIKKFMEIYIENKQRGLEYVNVEKGISLDRDLHYNIRK